MTINWVNQFTIIPMDKTIEPIDMFCHLLFLCGFGLSHLHGMLLSLCLFFFYDCLIIPSVILGIRHWTSQLNKLDVISIWNNFLSVSWVECFSIFMDQTIPLVDFWFLLLFLWLNQLLLFLLGSHFISFVWLLEISIIIWFWDWTPCVRLNIEIIWDNLLHVCWIVSLSTFMDQTIKFINFGIGSSWDLWTSRFLMHSLVSFIWLEGSFEISIIVWHRHNGFFLHVRNIIHLLGNTAYLM